MYIEKLNNATYYSKYKIEKKINIKVINNIK